MSNVRVTSMLRDANLPPTWAWKISPSLGSFSFPRSKRVQGLLRQCLVFSFSLKVVITILWSLPISAPGNVLVFAWLTLDLKRCSGTRMKSICLQTCPLGNCQVVVRDSLLGCRLLANMRRWLLANSSSFRPLSLASPMPNLLTLPAQFPHTPGPTLAFQSPWWCFHEGLPLWWIL